MRLVLTASLLVSCAAPLAARYTPPACDGSEYSDVPQASLYCPWIKQLKVDEITAGCGGGNYCPDNPVTRQMLAVMLERAVRGTDTFKIDAGTLDGFDSSQFQRKYAKVANVAQSGGDYNHPTTAMNNLGTWCGVPSSANTCLLNVWPGVYILPGALVLPSYVDLAGAGVQTTMIYRPGGAVAETPVVIAQGYGEIRDLSILSSGANHAMAVLANDGSQRTLRRVLVNAFGSAVGAIGLRVTNGSLVNLENCQVFAGSAPTALALEVAGGTPSKAVARMALLSAGSSAGGTCVGVEVGGGNHSVELYEAFASATSCGTGIGIRAAANGIWQGGYSSVFGSTVKNIAFQLVAPSSGFTIQGVFLQAFGADATALVVDSGGAVSLFGANLQGEDQSVTLSAGSDVFLENSIVGFGGLATTVAGDGFHIGNSAVYGAPSGPGTFKCVNSHDGAFDPVLADCT
jgi:hypothetical protein